MNEIKLVPTYGLKVLVNLLDALNPLKRSEAKHVLIVEGEGEFIELAYFKSELDARYAKRKLTKITRLSFREEYRFLVANIKELDKSKAA